MLKSELKGIYDFTDVIIPDELLNIEVSQEVIIEAVDQLAKKYLTIEEVYDGIASGDVIAVNLESNIPKYNKSTQISVGRGLFNKKLEENLLGMRKGNTKTICIDENSILTEIVSVKRRIIPDATDELVKKENIGGVCTVDEYKKYTYDEYVKIHKKYRMYEIIEEFTKEVIDKSEFELVDDEIDLIHNDMIKQAQIVAQRNNVSYEEYVKEIATEIFEEPTIEESEEYLFDCSVNRIKKILMGAYYAKKYGIQLNEETYEKDMITRANRKKTSVEHQKEVISYFDYLELKYKAFINKAIKDFCKDKVEFIINSI